MKIQRLVCILTVLMLTPNMLKAQHESLQYPMPQSSVSVYASSLLLASVVNLSYERLWKPAEESKVRLGFTVGYSLAVQHWSGGLDDAGMGPHLAFTLLAGKSDKFFELKLGGVAIYEWDEGGLDFAYPMPVISVGFRKQFPETGHFFRVGLSTAGFGIGLGFMI